MATLKVITVVGARPQFVKAAVVSRAFGKTDEVQELIIHTGQHYDPEMTDIFFEQMKIPTPDYHLGVGSAPHGAQTGRMLEHIEDILLKEHPDWVLVYGDTNSTLSGALAAVKCNIPLAHVEAGLRSYNRRMPEEINRILTDHASDRLFVPTEKAEANLKQEGIGAAHIERVGDVMYDAALFYADVATDSALVPEGEDYALATVHRVENTDDSERLETILIALGELGKAMPVLLPLHPRTRACLEASGRFQHHEGQIRFLDPVGYLDMVALEKGASIILTDSGGVQKEAYFLGKPCVTLREETEWVELIDVGWNRLAPPTDVSSVMAVIESVLATTPQDELGVAAAGLFGDGTAGKKIVQSLVRG